MLYLRNFLLEYSGYFDILNVKNAMVKAVYCATNYAIYNLLRS
jgi:hypothetical protein